MTDTAHKDPQLQRRAAVRRTAWILAGCAVASYALFLYSMTVGK